MSERSQNKISLHKHLNMLSRFQKFVNFPQISNINSHRMQKGRKWCMIIRHAFISLKIFDTFRNLHFCQEFCKIINILFFFFKFCWLNKFCCRVNIDIVFKNFRLFNVFFRLFNLLLSKNSYFCSSILLIFLLNLLRSILSRLF